MKVVRDTPFSMKQILADSTQGKLVSTKLFNVLMYLKSYLNRIGFILCVILVQNLLVFI